MQQPYDPSGTDLSGRYHGESRRIGPAPREEGRHPVAGLN
jgi:hypothetical protein